ncbi:MAG: protein kinase [Planctomycetes bacterium]|nr:protein kinase [Planctomycetota bacterium]
MDDCRNIDLIKRYVAGKCSEQELRAMELHAAQCTECQERIRSAQANKNVHGRPNSDDPQQRNAGDLTKTLTVHFDKSDDRPTAERLSVLSKAEIPDKALSSMLQHYLIINELPRGGQAIVYKAIHKATKMKVALKVLLPGLHGSVKARRHFEQEVLLAASLHHPNIVVIHDSGITVGQYYFSMEYIHGEMVDRYVDSHHMSLRDKLTLFNKICDAISHAHQRGVIHRDLKPPNILVDERGEPHILDFGLAKTTASSHPDSEGTMMPTITGQIKGTVQYMSPEQAAGQPDLIDVRTDIYSLGVILYKLLIGRFPYDVSESAFEVLHKIQSEEPIRPRQIVGKFDSDVEAILLKALAKDRNQRYQSAAEFQHDIQCFLEGFPIVAKSVSSLYLFRKIVARHRYTSTVVILLITIIFGFSIVSYHLYTRLRHKASQLQNTNQLMSKQTKEFAMFTPQVVFVNYFLPAWHNNDLKRTKQVEQYFSRGTKEIEATHFLLDQKPLIEKIAKFKEKLGTGNTSFVDFVIAEHYLKDGNRSEAAKAYQECLSHARPLKIDNWLIDKAQSRLFELGVETRQDKPSSVAGDMERKP